MKQVRVTELLDIEKERATLALTPVELKTETGSQWSDDLKTKTGFTEA